MWKFWRYKRSPDTYANKHITTGEGGMLLTDDRLINKKIRDYRNLCFGLKNNRFNHYDIGWNYRYTNIQAALGLNQLKEIKQIIKRKYEIKIIITKF